MEIEKDGCLVYDVIVIGAGNGGLMSALTLQEKGKKVLLIEKENYVGGLSHSFVRGRFEFDLGLRGMLGYENNATQGSLYHLFLRHQLEVEVASSKELYTLIAMNKKEIYDLPIGIEDFIEKIEEYVPRSKEPLKRFFNLVKEVNKAIKYLEETNNNPNKQILNREFKNFMTVAPYSTKRVLQSIHMPPKAREILESYALYLGCPATELSFVHYARVIVSLIQNGFTIPIHTSYDITSQIFEKYKELNGEYLLNSEVKEILVSQNTAHGVILKNGQKYECKYIIANISKRKVLESMIKKNLVPKSAMELEHGRSLGARGIVVYLGLNKSAEELNLKKYMYLIYNSLDSFKEFKKMKKTFSGNIVATIYNNAYASYSKKGTCIMEISSLIYGDDFTCHANSENYLEIKDKIADHFITTFENATGKKIRDSIEEMEVATPLTFARYSGHPSGVILGYLPYKEDGMIPRIVNASKEKEIHNLSFCGSFASPTMGFASSLINGEKVALQCIKEMER